MARERSDKSGVQFTRESARQIAETVRQSSDAGRGSPGMGTGSNPQPASHYLSKTSTAWIKGTSQTLTIWVGPPGSEAAADGQTVVAWNKFASIAANKWVMIARCNASFYLVAAEC